MGHDAVTAGPGDPRARSIQRRRAPGGRARRVVLGGLVLALLLAQAPSGAVPSALAGSRSITILRYDGPASSIGLAHGLALSPDGTRLFVTGQSEGRRDVDFATVAYDAATGAQRWVARTGGAGNDNAWSVGVSPDGSRVFVTGYAWGYGIGRYKGVVPPGGIEPPHTV